MPRRKKLATYIAAVVGISLAATVPALLTTLVFFVLELERSAVSLTDIWDVMFSTWAIVTLTQLLTFRGTRSK